MFPSLDNDQSLIRLILDRTEPETPADGHLDDNALALLMMGAASREERTQAFAHMVVCPDCRRLASGALVIAEGSGVDTKKVLAFSPRVLLWVAAAAACLLLTVTLTLRRIGNDSLAQAEIDLRAGRPAQALAAMRPALIRKTQPANRAESVARDAYRALMTAALGRSDFRLVESLAKEAEALGIRSSTLASLRSQAVRAIPTELALASIDRIDQFGVPLIGMFGKALPGGPAPTPAVRPADTRALEILDQALTMGPADRSAVLNRAHALLTRDPAEASRAFGRWLHDHPGDRDAVLGKALADYLNHDFPGSERAFGELVRLEPENPDLRLNHALALEAIGQPNPAASEWRAALDRVTDETLRSRIRLRLKGLGERHVKAYPRSQTD